MRAAALRRRGLRLSKAFSTGVNRAAGSGADGDAAALGQVVENDHVARAQCRHDDPLDVGFDVLRFIGPSSRMGAVGLRVAALAGASGGS